MTLNKSRLIYTAGTFKITDDLARCRRLLVSMSVLRLPFSAKYVNERSNPRKYFLGYMTVFINEYVHHVVPLEYEQQCVLLWENPAIQLYTTILCASKLASDNLVVHRASIPLSGALLPLLYDVAPFPGCSFTNLKFKLEFGCRISVVAVGEEIIECVGISPQATVPNLDLPPTRYPTDRPRSEDPERSDPEPGEGAGDTAIASLTDPDLGLSQNGTWTITWRYSQGGGVNCPFVGNVDTAYFSGSSTDEFTIVLVGENYILHQNGLPQSFGIGSNCVPSFNPPPVFTLS